MYMYRYTCNLMTFYYKGVGKKGQYTVTKVISDA